MQISCYLYWQFFYTIQAFTTGIYRRVWLEHLSSVGAPNCYVKKLKNYVKVKKKMATGKGKKKDNFLKCMKCLNKVISFKKYSIFFPLSAKL